MTEGWMVIEMSEGMIRDIIADPPVEILTIDYDDYDRYNIKSDPETAAEQIMETLERLRELMPPGPRRKAIRQDITKGWHQLNFRYHEGLVSDRWPKAETK